MFKKYLLRLKLPFVEGILENALVRVNVIRWEGFDIIPDASAGSGTTNADDDKHAMFFVAPGDNILRSCSQPGRRSLVPS